MKCLGRVYRTCFIGGLCLTILLASAALVGFGMRSIRHTKHNRAWGTEAPGASVFKLRDGDVYHTYSTFAVGLAELSLVHSVLDLTPTGRDEGGDRHNMWWIKHKEEYEAEPAAAKKA